MINPKSAANPKPTSWPVEYLKNEGVGRDYKTNGRLHLKRGRGEFMGEGDMKTKVEVEAAAVMMKQVVVVLVVVVVTMMTILLRQNLINDRWRLSTRRAIASANTTDVDSGHLERSRVARSRR